MKSSNIARFRALGIDRAVENAELQDKLDKAQNELRRAQAELRLNQSDYERSQVGTATIYTSVSILSTLSIHAYRISTHVSNISKTYLRYLYHLY